MGPLQCSNEPGVVDYYPERQCREHIDGKTQKQRNGEGSERKPLAVMFGVAVCLISEFSLTHLSR